MARDAAAKASAPSTALLDDRLYMFESVGLLLGQDEVPEEQQSAALQALLQPLTEQVGRWCRGGVRGCPGVALLCTAIHGP